MYYYNGESWACAEEVTVRASVREIPYEAFRNCQSLKSLIFELESHLETIGDYAFAGCTGLTFDISHFTKLNIGNYAFQSCTSMTGTLTLTDSILSLGTYAFSGTGFEEIVVDDSFTLAEFGHGIFSDCINLTAFTLRGPRSVLLFDYTAFTMCPKLKYFSCLGNSTFGCFPSNCKPMHPDLTPFFKGTDNIEVGHLPGELGLFSVLEIFSHHSQFTKIKQFIVPCDFNHEVRGHISVFHKHDNGSLCFATNRFIAFSVYTLSIYIFVFFAIQSM